MPRRTYPYGIPAPHRHTNLDKARQALGLPPPTPPRPKRKRKPKIIRMTQGRFERRGTGGQPSQAMPSPLWSRSGR